MRGTLKGTLCATALILALSVMATAQAGVHGKVVNPNKNSKVIFSNFVGNPPYDPSSGYFVDGPNFTNQILAMAFTPKENITFKNVVLPMAIYTDGGGVSRGRADVYLFTDGGGQPGTRLLGPLRPTGPIQLFNNGSGGGLVGYFCKQCPGLHKDTTYWVVAQTTQPPVQLLWDFANSDMDTPFAFDQTGSLNGPWMIVDSGVIRVAMEVDGQ